jgi:hypothetical protein
MIDPKAHEIAEARREMLLWTVSDFYRVMLSELRKGGLPEDIDVETIDKAVRKLTRVLGVGAHATDAYLKSVRNLPDGQLEGHSEDHPEGVIYEFYHARRGHEVP